MKQTQEKKYNKWGECLVDLVEGMEKDGLDPRLAVTLMLDHSISLTFHLNSDPDNAREAIKIMTESVAEDYEEHEKKIKEN
tara:strand:+ start:2136 stop:2378 length:243 start_codon:yes stop_codon:yes gene_type:complete